LGAARAGFSTLLRSAANDVVLNWAGGSRHSMRDAKIRASAASHFLEEALRALGAHRAWNDAIHLASSLPTPAKPCFVSALE